MSLRGGNDKKKGQKYQNSFSFRHNKNSLLTRKIRECPLDNLCKRCLDKLEWRINYRKYKPLTAATKCLKCEGKNIYKAYRNICDGCALTNKLCAKCTEPCSEYAKPNHWKNDPSKKKNQTDLLDEILKNLKERYKRTVERKFKEGEYLVFDKEKGIINEDTNEVVVELKSIIECGAWDPSSNQDDEIEDEINSNIKEEHDFSDSEEGEYDLNSDNDNENSNDNKDISKCDQTKYDKKEKSNKSEINKPSEHAQNK